MDTKIKNSSQSQCKIRELNRNNGLAFSLKQTNFFYFLLLTNVRLSDKIFEKCIGGFPMTKLRRTTVTVAAALVATTGLLGFLVRGGNNLTADAAEHVQPALELTAPTLDKGQLDQKGEAHYCLVAYSFTQEDPRPDYVQIKPTLYEVYNFHEFLTFPNKTSYYTVIPYSTGNNMCIPAYRYYCAYDSSYHYYSATQYIEDSCLNACKYPVNPECRYLLVETIPTEYDQSQNKWDHGADVGEAIHFSIAFNGIVVDGEVTVPWLGYRSVEIPITYDMTYVTEKGDTVGTIESVTFSVRTGPNAISIKADREVKCNNYNTMFAFEYFE